jgi:hypothetical protein
VNNFVVYYVPFWTMEMNNYTPQFLNFKVVSFSILSLHWIMLATNQVKLWPFFK